MASLRPAITHLRGRCQTSAPQWQQLRRQLQGHHISPNARHTRPLSTTRPYGSDNIISKDRFAEASLEVDRAMIDKYTKTAANLGPVGDDDGQQGAWAPAQNRQQWTPSEPSPNSERNRVPLRRKTYTAEPSSRGGPRQMSRENAAELDLTGETGWHDHEDEKGEPEQPGIHARAMPVSPSYFSRQAAFNDSYLKLQKLMRKYAHLPTAPSDQIKKVAFRSIKDYRLAVGEEIKAAPYARCMALVKKLHRIHPDLKPKAVDEAIAAFVRDINPHEHEAKIIPIDKFGRTLGVGKRKTSTARAWVVEGVGEVLVNGKSLADAFGRVHDRESAVWALKATARADKYNVWAIVEGGGTTGQAEALAMAVGKALLAHEPALKPALRRAGVVTRDPRGVERKKTGHLKARKKPAWVKR